MEPKEILKHLLEWDLHPEAREAIIQRIKGGKDEEAPVPDVAELVECM